MANSGRLIRSRRVLLPDGLKPASIRISNGVIEAVGRHDVSGAEDFGNLVIMPGIIDTHVQIGEPANQGAESVAATTQAAAAGGVTTIIETPLSPLPQPTMGSSLQAKKDAARGQCWVDVGFWGPLVPATGGKLRALWDEGCFGFECFVGGSDAAASPALSESQLRQAMTEIASLGGVLLAHTEDPPRAADSSPSAPERRYSSYLASHPRLPEDARVELLVRLVRETRCPVHLLHLGTSHPLSLLAPARSIGAPVTVETCPHYLTFAAEEISDGATEFKCSPPIRESYNRDALWLGLSNQIDMIVSDQLACPSAMKRKDTGDFAAAWPGIASLEIGLAAVWTEARYRDFTLSAVARWMCSGPAEIAGLRKRKGSIEAGYDADLTIWHPEASFMVDPGRFRQRQDMTPYAGRRLYGKVQQTMLRGRTIELDGPPTGEVMLRRDD